MLWTDTRSRTESVDAKLWSYKFVRGVLLQTNFLGRGSTLNYENVDVSTSHFTRTGIWKKYLVAPDFDVTTTDCFPNKAQDSFEVSNCDPEHHHQNGIEASDVDHKRLANTTIHCGHRQRRLNARKEGKDGQNRPR